MAEPFIGEIRIFPYNFAPRDWAYCDGQLMAISQNTALFAVLGTTYGGDGKSNFALPNLQGRVPLHAGAGPGLTPRSLGETGGSESVALSESQMPPHSHQVQSSGSRDATNDPQGNLWASTGRGGAPLYTTYSESDGVTLSPAALVPSGGGAPHNNRQPYLTLAFCIALRGVFPPRA